MNIDLHLAENMVHLYVMPSFLVIVGDSMGMTPQIFGRRL